MSSKSAIGKAFNTHFFEFLDDIISIFPENQDIPTARTSFDAIKRANPTAIIKAWYKFVYLPYAEVINAGNIDFFANKDYGNDLENLQNSNEIMHIIDKIRGPIRDMNEANKAHSAKYIQNLSKMSNLYIELAN